MLALVGVAGGVALAACDLFLHARRRGQAGRPRPGFSFDALLLVPAGLGAVAVVLALGLWPAAKWARPFNRDERPVTHPSRAVERPGPGRGPRQAR